ncbi:MAG: TMEM165/GDT1 family protein [Armatimonadota bacterium]
MDWKPFVSTFTLLLLAELGDKTQLAVISQAAKFRSPLLVFLGAGAALLAVSALGVVLGQVCATCLPRDLIRWVAGGAFILMGLLMLAGRI